MKTIDIREDNESPVKRIVFASYAGIDCVIDKDDLCIKALHGGEEDQYYEVESAEEAENLIKALQKALELGWFK